MIKKVLFYIALISALILIGCTSGEEPGFEESSLRDQLIGKWYQTEYRSPSTGTFIGQEDGSYIEFKSNGSFIYFYSGWGSFNETQTGTFSVAGSSIVNLSISDGSSGSITILDIEGSTATFQLFGIGSGILKYVKK